MTDGTTIIVLSLTLLMVSVFTMVMQLREKKKLKKINTWANDRIAEIEGPMKIMAAHARLNRVYKAHLSGNLTEMMLALDIDVEDPLFRDLDFREFDGIIAVRVADLKRVVLDKE